MTSRDVGVVDGQVAMVTGASSGLGRATALALARAGADLALLARREEDLRKVGEEVEETSRRALTLSVDLSNEGETRGAVERTVDALGRVDVLVNAAGNDVSGPVAELEVKD